MNICSSSRRLVSSTGRRFFLPSNQSIRVTEAANKSLGTNHLPTSTLFPMGQTARHASSVRRRRGTVVQHRTQEEKDEDRAAAPHVAVKDPVVFQQEADKLLTKLEAALRPMEKQNEVFHITLTPRNEYTSGSLTVELKPEDGSYRIEVNDDAKLVHMTCASSGHYNYVLSASTGEWVDEQDGHSMEGMLVRDLIRCAMGLPDL